MRTAYPDNKCPVLHHQSALAYYQHTPVACRALIALMHHEVSDRSPFPAFFSRCVVTLKGHVMRQGAADGAAVRCIAVTSYCKCANPR